ncbi:hypothetical protein chiPu_0005019 [Chiloscyllium punctatum]|uniref:Uncharacterized protein n=1 Tax=Chiloscyllium punctatum TaxID=137246 RepID=A0A401S888_CHIPU|nr:hypothetical protein [Chiloscyllium punctatum]
MKGTDTRSLSLTCCSRQECWVWSPEEGGGCSNEWAVEIKRRTICREAKTALSAGSSNRPLCGDLSQKLPIQRGAAGGSRDRPLSASGAYEMHSPLQLPTLATAA